MAEGRKNFLTTNNTNLTNGPEDASGSANALAKKGSFVRFMLFVV